MLANMVCSLIKHKRVTTTLAKAKAVRPVAEKMVTLGKKGSLHHRRLAVSRLHQEDAVRILFNEIAPQHQDRQGGYTRIYKLLERRGDAAQMAIIEFVESGDAAASNTDDTAATTEASTSQEEASGKVESAEADVQAEESAANDSGSETSTENEEKKNA